MSYLTSNVYHCNVTFDVIDNVLSSLSSIKQRRLAGRVEWFVGHGHINISYAEREETILEYEELNMNSLLGI